MLNALRADLPRLWFFGCCLQIAHTYQALWGWIAVECPATWGSLYFGRTRPSDAPAFAVSSATPSALITTQYDTATHKQTSEPPSRLLDYYCRLIIFVQHSPRSIHGQSRETYSCLVRRGLPCNTAHGVEAGQQSRGWGG